jgi:cytoskeletal protein CcmA (bactofilin family)
MFRRKDAETGRMPEGEPPFPRAVSEPKLGQPELPRRPVDLPVGHAPLAPERTELLVEAAPAPEKKQLIVGHGISLSGEITACDKLIVLGSVQVTLNQTRAIEITETGRFTNGRAEVEEAEISGLYEGDLTVKKRLLIRSTGQVKGNVRYGELEIEQGGKISGSIAMISEQPSLKAAEAA